MANTIVADTILKQLGGRRFIAMTGAKNFLAIGSGQAGLPSRGLRFRIPGTTTGKCNMVEITLNDADTYDMVFMRVRGSKATVVQDLRGIYADRLPQAFTSVTGLDAHL